VPHIGLPQSEPVKIVKIEKIRPRGAMDLAIISAKGCFHIRKKILAILMLKYRKDANHAKGT
jgi:hypothetical protein